MCVYIYTYMYVYIYIKILYFLGNHLACQFLKWTVVAFAALFQRARLFFDRTYFRDTHGSQSLSSSSGS